jgi:hypothetical protein
MSDQWRFVGAGLLAPVTAASLRRPEWRPLAALLWHQTEEWVWPGGFKRWINREVIGSDEDDFPLDARVGFVVNVAIGWSCSLLARHPAPATFLYVTHLGNAGLHAGWAVRHRRYDPGLVTAVACLAPVAVTGLRELWRERAISRAGAIAGIVGGAGLAPLLKARIRAT